METKSRNILRYDDTKPELEGPKRITNKFAKLKQKISNFSFIKTIHQDIQEHAKEVKQDNDDVIHVKNYSSGKMLYNYEKSPKISAKHRGLNSPSKRRANRAPGSPFIRTVYQDCMPICGSPPTPYKNKRSKHVQDNERSNILFFGDDNRISVETKRDRNNRVSGHAAGDQRGKMPNGGNVCSPRLTKQTLTKHTNILNQRRQMLHNEKSLSKYFEKIQTQNVNDGGVGSSGQDTNLTQSGIHTHDHTRYSDNNEGKKIADVWKDIRLDSVQGEAISSSSSESACSSPKSIPNMPRMGRNKPHHDIKYVPQDAESETSHGSENASSSSTNSRVSGMPHSQQNQFENEDFNSPDLKSGVPYLENIRLQNDLSDSRKDTQNEPLSRQSSDHARSPSNIRRSVISRVDLHEEKHETAPCTPDDALSFNSNVKSSLSHLDNNNSHNDFEDRLTNGARMQNGSSCPQNTTEGYQKPRQGTRTFDADDDRTTGNINYKKENCSTDFTDVAFGSASVILARVKRLKLKYNFKTSVQSLEESSGVEPPAETDTELLDRKSLDDAGLDGNKNAGRYARHCDSVVKTQAKIGGGSTNLKYAESRNDRKIVYEGLDLNSNETKQRYERIDYVLSPEFENTNKSKADHFNQDNCNQTDIRYARQLVDCKTIGEQGNKGDCPTKGGLSLSCKNPSQITSHAEHPTCERDIRDRKEFQSDKTRSGELVHAGYYNDNEAQTKMAERNPDEILISQNKTVFVDEIFDNVDQQTENNPLLCSSRETAQRMTEACVRDGCDFNCGGGKVRSSSQEEAQSLTGLDYQDLSKRRGERGKLVQIREKYKLGNLDSQLQLSKSFKSAETNHVDGASKNKVQEFPSDRKAIENDANYFENTYFQPVSFENDRKLDTNFELKSFSESNERGRLQINDKNDPNITGFCGDDDDGYTRPVLTADVGGDADDFEDYLDYDDYYHYYDENGSILPKKEAKRMQQDTNRLHMKYFEDPILPRIDKDIKNKTLDEYFGYRKERKNTHENVAVVDKPQAHLKQPDKEKVHGHYESYSRKANRMREHAALLGIYNTRSAINSSDDTCSDGEVLRHDSTQRSSFDEDGSLCANTAETTVNSDAVLSSPCDTTTGASIIGDIFPNACIKTSASSRTSNVPTSITHSEDDLLLNNNLPTKTSTVNSSAPFLQNFEQKYDFKNVAKVSPFNCTIQKSVAHKVGKFTDLFFNANRDGNCTHAEVIKKEVASKEIKDVSKESIKSGIYEKILAQCAKETLVPEGILESYLAIVIKKNCLLFHGTPGTGKSFLARSTANLLISWLENENKKVSSQPIYYSNVGAEQLNALLKNCQSLEHSERNAVFILDGFAVNFCERGIEQLDKILQQVNNVYIIGVIQRFELQCLSSALSDSMVLLTNSEEPTSGLLSRYLESKFQALGEGDIKRLRYLSDWLAQVLDKTNSVIERFHSANDVFGPSIFFSCPGNFEEAEEWFTDVWSYSLLPFLKLNVRQSIWKELLNWIIGSYPWTNEEHYGETFTIDVDACVS